jgi:DNA polymerase
LILSQKYNIHPTHRWVDTLSMARAKLPNAKSHSLNALGEHFGLGLKERDGLIIGALHWSDLSPDQQVILSSYAWNDVKLLQALYGALTPFPEAELDLIDLTLRMVFEPRLQLDRALAEELLRTNTQNKLNLLETCGLTRTQLSSNKQFAEWLEAQGVEIPKKISPTTGKETYALGKNDDGFKALRGKNPVVDAALDARLAIKSTLEETRLATLIDTQERMGSIPVPLKYYGGHTGRWSGLIFNLQNLPSKSRIRNTLRAPEGFTLLICDSASIEARIVLWLAGQEDAIQAYREGRDIYKIMAASIYNTTYEEVTKDQRTLGKLACLGLGYSMGANKFQATCKIFGVDITHSEAQKIVTTYRTTFYQVPALWKLCESYLPLMKADHCEAMPESVGSGWGDQFQSQERSYNPAYQPNTVLYFGEECIELPNGLRLHYPNLHQTEYEEWFYNEKTKIFPGSMVENVVQALARIVIGEQILRAHREVGPVVLTVHDEIVCCVPKEGAEAKLPKLLEIMRTPPSALSTLPLDAEGRISDFYLK